MAEENNGTAAASQVAAVDETPISPVRPDRNRKNSLEQHLLHRPNRAELVEREYLATYQPEQQAMQGAKATVLSAGPASWFSLRGRLGAWREVIRLFCWRRLSLA